MISESFYVSYGEFVTMTSLTKSQCCKRNFVLKTTKIVLKYSEIRVSPDNHRDDIHEKLYPVYQN